MTQNLQDLINYKSTYKNWKHAMKYQRECTKELILKMED